MSEWRKVRIGDFLKRVKDPVKIEPSRTYKLVTVKMHHQGVTQREEKLGKLIGSNMYRVSKGQFILSGIDSRNGAFGIVPDELDGAIVTNDFWYFDIDENAVTRDFFLWLTNTPLFLGACIKSSEGTTNRRRLQPDKFYNFEFVFPKISEQKVLLQRLSGSDNLNRNIASELDKQLSLLKQLRQAILQEAVEGKLTADWRASTALSLRQAGKTAKGNPEFDAGALLEKIKAEKEKLIKEGKIRKEKPLAPIKQEEKPFELPEGWVWCRLGEIIVYTDNLDIHKNLPPDKIICYVDIDSIDNHKHRIREIKKKPVSELSSRARRVLRKGYIIYSTVRPYLENIAHIDEDIEYCIGSTGFNVFKSVIAENSFIFNFLLSPVLNEQFKKNMIGFNSPSITNDQFENTLFPLPPLAEQRAIVSCVNSLMSYLDELEQQITERKSQSEMLMQSVLREAFE